MRNGRVGYRLDFVDTQNAQVGPPSVNGEKRVIIGAEIPRDPLTRHGSNNHSAEYRAIDIPGRDGEADDSPGKLVHHDEHPVGF